MSINVHAAEADEAELNTTINTTPLVDVMLVLLIIFLITVPVIRKQIPVDLPNASNIPTITKPQNIVIAVDKDENIYWNNQPVDASELKDRFADALRAGRARRAAGLQRRMARAAEFGASHGNQPAIDADPAHRLQDTHRNADVQFRALVVSIKKYHEGDSGIQ